MLNVTELKAGIVFYDKEQLLQVLSYEHIKMGRGSGTVKVKVKNLKTSAIVEKSFTTGARVDEALVEKRKTQFLYNDSEQYFFMDQQTFDQFPVSKTVLGEQAKYLKEGLEVQLIVSEDEAIGLELPLSLIYEVSQTGPSEKGNTVSSVYKEAILENGLIVKVPMFINNGDRVKVDTRSGEYMERVK